MAAELLSPELKLFEDNRGMPGGVAVIYAKWQSDADGDFAQAIKPLISGRIVEVITNPDDTAAPSDNYNVTLVSALSGHDLLEGRGATRDTATTETALVLKEQAIGGNTYAAAPYICEAGATLTIDSAGDSKKGEVWIIVE